MLVLASTSPRRIELLKSLGIDFQTVAPPFEETPTSLQAGEEALYFAEQKARSVADRCPNSLVLASDTLIECEGEKLGKPKDKNDAERMLKHLSGKTHNLYTAVVLLNTAKGSLKKHLETVKVTFKPLSQVQIDDYVASGEPMGKAGGYAIQEKGNELVQKIEGDINAVIGLTLKLIKEWLHL